MEGGPGGRGSLWTTGMGRVFKSGGSGPLMACITGRPPHVVNKHRSITGMLLLKKEKKKTEQFISATCKKK